MTGPASEETSKGVRKGGDPRPDATRFNALVRNQFERKPPSDRRFAHVQKVAQGQKDAQVLKDTEVPKDKPRADDDNPSGRTPSQTAEYREPALSPPVTLRPQEPKSALTQVGHYAVRTARLAMDATLLVVFSPLIAAWLLIERVQRSQDRT